MRAVNPSRSSASSANSGAGPAPSAVVAAPRAAAGPASRPVGSVVAGLRRTLALIGALTACAVAAPSSAVAGTTSDAPIAVAEPAVADFVPASRPATAPWGHETTDGLALAQGSVIYEWTRIGSAPGITVLYENQDTGLRYRVVTDANGLYRMRVPEGDYDIWTGDPATPERFWTGPNEGWSRGHNTYGEGGIVGNVLTERPRYSCLTRHDVVVEGFEGWAPDADPATARCRYQTPVPMTPESLAAWLNYGPGVAAWGIEGKAPPVHPADAARASAAGVPPAAPTFSLAVPRTLTAAAGVVRVPVACGGAAACTGRVVVTAAVPRPRERAAARRVVVASTRVSTAAPRATLRLRLTAAGRALSRSEGRRRVAVQVRWTPTGSTASATTRNAWLRVGR